MPDCPCKNKLSCLPKTFQRSRHHLDYTYHSWFSVLWQPIYCLNHSPTYSCGSFLAYYLVRPPRHLFAQAAQTPLEGPVPFPPEPYCWCCRIDSQWEPCCCSWYGSGCPGRHECLVGRLTFRIDRHAVRFEYWRSRIEHEAPSAAAPMSQSSQAAAAVMAMESRLLSGQELKQQQRRAGSSTPPEEEGGIGPSDDPLPRWQRLSVVHGEGVSTATHSLKRADSVTHDDQLSVSGVSSQSNQSSPNNVFPLFRAAIPLIGLLPSGRARPEAWYCAATNHHNGNHHNSNPSQQQQHGLFSAAVSCRSSRAVDASPDDVVLNGRGSTSRLPEVRWLHRRPDGVQRGLRALAGGGVGCRLTFVS